jgi:predicted dithiol-disulfide oxidoreductase (DUF899 family)
MESIMQHKVVSRDEWIAARKAHLANEKAITKARDQLSAERRALPWVKVEENYLFDTPEGKKTLADLFDGRSQLIVYHFMLGPGWGEGCPSCSYLADHFDGAALHLAHRDVRLLAVSRAPLPEIAAYKKRMGWRFPWVSSGENDFNYDFHVSFRPEQEEGEVYCNYEMCDFQRDARRECVHQRAFRGHIPHLLGLCARSRHPGRHLQFPRPRAQRPRRSGAAMEHGLGAAP